METIEKEIIWNYIEDIMISLDCHDIKEAKKLLEILSKLLEWFVQKED